MKKLLLTVGGIALFGLGFATNLLVDHMSEKEKMQETDTSYHVIETEKATVEYWDIENGDFDVLITPKGEYNISPEFSLSDQKFYEGGYLVGKTKQAASELYESNLENFDITYDFSWGN